MVACTVEVYELFEPNFGIPSRGKFDNTVDFLFTL